MEVIIHIVFPDAVVILEIIIHFTALVNHIISPYKELLLMLLTSNWHLLHFPSSSASVCSLWKSSSTSLPGSTNRRIRSNTIWDTSFKSGWEERKQVFLKSSIEKFYNGKDKKKLPLNKKENSINIQKNYIQLKIFSNQVYCGFRCFSKQYHNHHYTAHYEYS